MTRVLLLVPVCLALSVSACNNSTNTTSPTPATPSLTETFSGVVQPGMSDAHNFTVTQAGEVDVTLTSAVMNTAAGPLATIQMGVGIGSPTATTCPAPLAFGSVIVSAGPNIAGSIIANAGTYCIDVFDVGNQSGPVTYTVTVAHP